MVLPSLTFYGSQKTLNATLDKQLGECDNVVHNLMFGITKAQEWMKEYADHTAKWGGWVGGWGRGFI